MKKFRKILQSALSILMAFVLVFSVGCKKDTGPQAVIKPAPEAPAPTFELNKSQVVCIVGDTSQLAPKSLPNIGDATLTWRSENSDIVTVDSNGRIEAISEGTAKVIATYGNISAECSVKVEWDDEVPQIVSPAGADGKFAIVVGQEYTFAPTIVYRNKTYTDGNLNVAVSNDAVTALDTATSTITGATNGVSTVTISGKWRGRDALRATFNVTVSGDIVLSATDANENIYQNDQISLYTQAVSFDNGSDQASTSAFLPLAKVRNDINNEPTVIDINSNPEAFSVTLADNRATYNAEDKTIQAVTYGDTIATINFDYEGQTYVKQFYVHIERPTADFTKEVNYFSAVKGTLRDENQGFKDITLKEFVYGDQDVEVVSASFNGQDLQLEQSTGAIFGVTGTNASTYEAVVAIGTEVEQFNVKMTVYGQYVYDATDLDVFVRTAASPELDVYVELGRDLDLASYVKANHFNDVDSSSASTDPNKKILPGSGWEKNRFVAKGFMGTFNGNGHYLMNYKQTGAYGFFAGLTKATVKNVGFVNCQQNAATFFASFADYVNMENVYISLTNMQVGGWWSTGVISQYWSPGGLYKNVYIDLEQADVNAEFPQGRDRYYWALCSSFMNLPKIDGVQPTFENCLVISKAPISSIGYESNTEGPRVVYAENISETKRTELRQMVWNAQTDAQKNSMKSRYNSLFSSDKMGVYQNPNKFVDDESLYFEHYNNKYLDAYGREHRRTSIVGVMPGIRAYDTVNDMLLDPTSKDYLNTFSSEFWTIIEGKLNWGKHPANLKDGDVFLDAGILAGKQVEGVVNNPLNGFTAGQTVEVGTLSCFGYIFDGWKNNTTGEMLTLDSATGKYTFTYSGKATILVAQWKLDPNVQVGSGIK